jgi:hypothetical protein
MAFALMIIFSRTVNFLFTIPGVETQGYQTIAPTELKNTLLNAPTPPFGDVKKGYRAVTVSKILMSAGHEREQRPQPTQPATFDLLGMYRNLCRIR